MNVITTVLFFTVFLLAAQINAVAGEKTGEVLFNRNDKVLTWQTNNNGSFALSKDVDFRINSALSTTLNLTTGKGIKDRWYDTINNRAELEYAISDKFDLIFSSRCISSGFFDTFNILPRSCVYFYYITHI